MPSTSSSTGSTSRTGSVERGHGRAEDRVDRVLDLVPAGGGGDDLVAGRLPDRLDRVVVARIGERDDELACPSKSTPIAWYSRATPSGTVSAASGWSGVSVKSMKRTPDRLGDRRGEVLLARPDPSRAAPPAAPPRSGGNRPWRSRGRRVRARGAPRGTHRVPAPDLTASSASLPGVSARVGSDLMPLAYREPSDPRHRHPPSGNQPSIPAGSAADATPVIHEVVDNPPRHQSLPHAAGSGTCSSSKASSTISSWPRPSTCSAGPAAAWARS